MSEFDVVALPRALPDVQEHATVTPAPLAPPARAPGFSGLGLASILLAAAGGLVIFLAIVYAAFKQLQAGADISGNQGLMMLVGVVMIGGSLLLLAGLILGIAGLFQAGRRKLLPALGTAFSAGLLVCFGGLMLIGLAR